MTESRLVRELGPGPWLGLGPHHDERNKDQRCREGKDKQKDWNERSIVSIKEKGMDGMIVIKKRLKQQS